MRSFFRPVLLALAAATLLNGAAATALAQDGTVYYYRSKPAVLVSGANGSPEDLGEQTPGGGDTGGGDTGGEDPAPTVTLSLAEASDLELFKATVNEPWMFDFNTLLTAEGVQASDVTWEFGNPAAPGGLSPWLGFAPSSPGVVAGTPAEAGSYNFEVVASHGDAEGRRVYTLVVNGIVIKVTAIAAGESHTCAITASGGAMCWGDGSFGKLGHGSLGSSNIPVQVVGLTSGVEKIAAGSNHTCVIHNGAAKCWGIALRNGDGSQNSSANRTSPVSVDVLTSGVTDIEAGMDHTCAVHNGSAKCWGMNNFGQLGNNNTNTGYSPVPVTNLGSGVTKVTAGTDHSCAIQNGKPWCWGRGENYRLGNDSTNASKVPVAVSGIYTASAPVTDVSAGYQHTCMVHNGAVKCWGMGGSGQLGKTGSNTTRPIPQTSDIGSGATAVSAGGQHTCALQGGVLKCWGSGISGATGLGNNNDSSTPTTVIGLVDGVTSFSAGSTHTCAVHNGSAKCWGSGTSGKLGNGFTSGSSTPQNVSGL